MKFMLLCYDDEKYWQQAGAEAHQAAIKEAIDLTHELHANGQYCYATPLQPVATATCVRIRDGKRTVTDGPFAETREVLGGFYIIDVDNIEQAIDIAARHSGARVGGVEVRPILEIPGLPG